MLVFSEYLVPMLYCFQSFVRQPHGLTSVAFSVFGWHVCSFQYYLLYVDGGVGVNTNRLIIGPILYSQTLQVALLRPPIVMIRYVVCLSSACL